jgi:FAD:protein FMN transferase
MNSASLCGRPSRMIKFSLRGELRPFFDFNAPDDYGRAYELLAARRAGPFLVNLGGDLRANHQPPSGRWQIGVEQPESDRKAALLLQLEHGALATSGDLKRFLLKDGVRYGHVLDPRTGWPVPGAPRSVTVAASSCTEAGLISTLALLHGARAGVLG